MGRKKASTELVEVLTLDRWGDKIFSMRISILLATLSFTLAVLFSSCNSAYAQADNIGQSQISPASPLYFLKAVREILELKFAVTINVKVIRQLEFATRRLREVKSLSLTSHQDLIEPTLEQYWSNLKHPIDIVTIREESLDDKVSTGLIIGMDFLQRVYDQVSNPRARMSIRSTIHKLSELDQQLIDELNKSSRSRFSQKVLESKLSACNFLAKVASSSALGQVEKAVFQERSQKCFK